MGIREESPEYLRRYGYLTNWSLQGLTPEGSWRTYRGVFLGDVPADFRAYVARDASAYPWIASWRILDTSANTVIASTDWEN